MNLTPDVAGWFWRAALLAACVPVLLSAAGCGRAGPPLSLHPASSMVRIGGPSGVASPRPAGAWEIELARNESEAFQVQVRRRGRPAGEPLAVEVRVQEAAAGAPDPGARVDVFQVLDVHHAGPAEHRQFKVPKRRVGWVPDVCWPTRTARAQAHKPGEVTFLFDVHAAADAAPGTWRYRVAFTRPGRADPPAELDLTVRVRPFALPVRLPFATAVTWNWGIEKYLGRPLTPPQRRAYLEFFCRHRLTPAAFWSVGPDMTAEEITFVVARGGNVFQIYGRGGNKPFTDKQKADLTVKLKKWRATMQAAGALRFCYALIADEPADEHLPAIAANARFLKSVFPELKIWVATAPRKELMDVVDCWDVVTAASTDFYRAHAYRAADVAAAHAAGAEYWWFYSVEPYAPHPNARIDDDLADARAIGWMSFAAGVDGFEYFWATDWAGNAAVRGAPWPEKAARWNTGLSGAGQLCYPGDDGLPIPSLRLINLRDGMEDWAAFRQAGLVPGGAPKQVRDPARLAALRRKAYRILSQRP